jgi:hypothetical protein
MVKMFDEILKELNLDLSLYEKFKKDTSLPIILSYAFDADKKMKLPEGVPPFRKDPAPRGMSPTNLRFESKRLYVFTRGDVSDKRREVLFVQLLESLYATEANILCHIKDQTLHTIYPNITHEWAASVGLRCPVSKEEQKSVVSEPIKESVVEVESATEQVEQGDTEPVVDALFNSTPEDFNSAYRPEATEDAPKSDEPQQKKRGRKPQQ